MLNYGYLVYQAERTKTQPEQRETDAQLGQLSAAFAQLLRPLTKPARALRRQPGTEVAGTIEAELRERVARLESQLRGAGAI